MKRENNEVEFGEGKEEIGKRNLFIVIHTRIHTQLQIISVNVVSRM